MSWPDLLICDDSARPCCAQLFARLSAGSSADAPSVVSPMIVFPWSWRMRADGTGSIDSPCFSLPARPNAERVDMGIMGVKRKGHSSLLSFSPCLLSDAAVSSGPAESALCSKGLNDISTECEQMGILAGRLCRAAP